MDSPVNNSGRDYSIMKKICFVTGTRADYGIMAPVMREVAQSPLAQLQIIATNMHLSPIYGSTISEIEADGFKVDVAIDSLVPGGSAKATVESMAKVENGLAEAFKSLNPDLVVILGDRYEALAAAAAAVVFNIPVAHLHGGETSEGAIDDKFRHAITKLSTYHFAATPQYADRIISMGENPEHVFHSGAPGAECLQLSPVNSVTSQAPVGLMPVDDLSREQEQKDAKDFFDKTGIYPGQPFILLAFHPVTTLDDKGIFELQQTIKALDVFIIQGYSILLTMPNSDPGTESISRTLLDWAEKNKGSVVAVKSLGARLFHYALDNAMAIVGNSSAALIEAPSHRLGAVNVGMRQKGRAHGITVVDAAPDKDSIATALNSVLSFEMKALLLGMPVSALNPYYKENASKFIAEKLMEL